MKIILQGYRGKMGQIVKKELEKSFSLILVDFDAPMTQVEEKDILAIVDFSSKEGFNQAFQYALKHHLPLISGTTGMSEEELLEVKRKSEEEGIPVYVVANFLPIFSLWKKVLPLIAENYTSITLEEVHHQSKKDAPSGTAKELLRMLPKEKVTSITAVREEGYLYRHTITFYSPYDSFTMTHQCYDKIGYAKGVLKALADLQFVGLRTELPWKNTTYISK